VFSDARLHVPANTVVAASDSAQRSNADSAIAIGGGSTTGLGKALALNMSLPFIAIPTSYSGSEMTNIWGITEDGRKSTGRDNKVLPSLTIYDPGLTLGLPPDVSAASGMNAIAQAAVNIVEVSPDKALSELAEEGVRKLAGALPIVVSEPGNVAARSDALYGACLAGAAIGAGTTSLHHKLCHVIGGRFDTNHAATHSILLPHTIRYNMPAAPEGAAKLAAALGAADAFTGLRDLAENIGAPTTLRSLGLTSADLDAVVDSVIAANIRNPRTVERDSLRAMLQDAY
jgi:alcohol dehydrogenase class IV